MQGPMEKSESGVKAKLRGFVSGNFLLGKSASELGETDSFLESGIVDSTGILEFVDFLKETWDIEVADEDLLPENFDSIKNLTSFVLRKTA
ncbi:MAG: acyl carrier protein [Fibrobacteria bacterium]